MINPHILFRFHKAFDVCEQNIRLLRRLNPDVPIRVIVSDLEGLIAES